MFIWFTSSVLQLDTLTNFTFANIIGCYIRMQAILFNCKKLYIDTLIFSICCIKTYFYFVYLAFVTEN